MAHSVYNIKAKTIDVDREIVDQAIAIKAEVDSIMSGDCACLFKANGLHFVDNVTGDFVLDTATQQQKDDIKAYLDGLV